MKTWKLAAVVLLGALWGAAGCTNSSVQCKSTEECALGEDCIEGQCLPAEVYSCSDDLDCSIGEQCVAGVCQRNRQDGGGVLRPDAGNGSSGGPSGLGVLELTPFDVLDFGSPVVGLAIPKSVIVKNRGEGPLWIFSATRTSGTSEEFAVETSVTVPRQLAVGEEMRITVTYTLADGEADTGSISINSDASGCTFSCVDPQNVRVSLFSEFKGVRNLELTPALHDFGFVAQGMTSTPFSFTARNDGTQTKLLTVQSISLSGADATQFHLDPGLVAPAYLQPATDLAIPITYAPTAEGNHTAELIVRANSDNPERQEIRVTVTGRSVPTVDISADPIDFGHLEVNQTATRTTTIYNNSNVAVTITGGDFLNGTQNFYVPTPLPYPINITAGGTATMDVQFRPTGQAGARNDTLRLSHTLGANPVPVALSGIADPPPPPPGGPDLSIAMTFTREDAAENGCNANSLNNWQNMDLILEGGGGTCEKPATQAEANARCNGQDNFCMCSFGSQGGGNWRASGGIAPEPYLNEVITHNQTGGDGTFYVQNRYADDCSDDWNDQSAAIIQGICGYGGQPPMRYMCFPYERYPYLYQSCGLSGPPYNGYCINETSCLTAAPAIASGSCEARRPSTARTVITIKSAQGAVVEQRAFCRTFQQASPTKQQVVALIREGGNFRVGPLAAGTQEVAVGANCP